MGSGNLEQLPICPIFGRNKGQIEWRRPVYETIINMLHNPTYALGFGNFTSMDEVGRTTTGVRILTT